MQKNEQNSKNAPINVGIIRSDHFYINKYRTELDKAYMKLKETPKARIDAAGIMIVSHRSQEYIYPMDIESYGEVNNIINTLALALIRKLKDFTKKERDIQEAVLERFMESFERTAYFEFFGADDLEDEETDEID